MQTKERAANTHVAIALMFMLLGITWSDLSGMEDQVTKDNSAIGGFCAVCRVSLHAHAYKVSLSSCWYPWTQELIFNYYLKNSCLQDAAQNALYCHVCNKGDVTRKHITISSFSQLERLRTFVERHIPKSPFAYAHPAMRYEWLNELARTLPSQFRPVSGLPLWLSVDEWTACIKSVISCYKHANTPYTTEHTEKTVMDNLLRGKGPAVDHPMLHPMSLPTTTNYLTQLVDEFRKGDVILDSQRGIYDFTSTTLAFFSPAGVCTPFHLDWSEAKNVALEVKVSPMKE